ncbi:MAG: hypothetical protein ABNH53_08880 [Henriciella sp.]|jgi:hypothetical protein
MAKALFHKAQRVYVKPVGTYALVEKVIPHWVKGVEEPLRVTYDCGLGREFTAAELVSEEALRGSDRTSQEDVLLEQWRIQRLNNRWQSDGDASHHPYPGTYPVVLTEDNDWGGWRVPGAEYNRDPGRIEHQARMIVNAPDMVRVIKAVLQSAQKDRSAFPKELMTQLKKASHILRHVYDVTDQSAPAVAAE